MMFQQANGWLNLVNTSCWRAVRQGISRRRLPSLYCRDTAKMHEIKKYREEFLKEAHKLSIFNKEWIKKSEVCGCFYCQTIFGPDRIMEWTDNGHPKGLTALCPNCGIDAVIVSNPN